MKEKDKGGRPTLLTSEALEKAEYYANNYRDMGDAIPTVVGLALYLGVATGTIYNWVKSERCDKFLNIFTRIEQMQHQDLVNNGLLDKFNPAITKMMLTKHGYSDKQELAHTSPDGSMSPTRIEIVAPDMEK